MDKILILAALFSMILQVPCRAFDYEISAIPEEVRKDADAVIREYEMTLEIHSISEATMKVTKVVTIFKDRAFFESFFMVVYDKFSHLSKLKGVIYDQNGKEIKKVHKDDLYDFSAISGYSLYEDNRVKYLRPSHLHYPFTVEFHYEIKYEGLLSVPNFFPQPKDRIGVEKANLTVSAPIDQRIKFYEHNMPATVNEVTDKGTRTYNWELKNLPALILEPWGKSVTERRPAVYLASSEFSIEDSKGSMESWKSFGDWYMELNSGRLDLDEGAKEEIRDQVEGASDEVEKIKLVYEYLQNNTRYVSIQLGIGGWQSFPASMVNEKGYGDCKALSTYTKALLEAVDIESHYVLVRAGENAPDIISEFPSNQFNHLFLCVPTALDTIWLECTSQSNPFGYLGNFTGGRDVLVVKEGGSKLVKSPECVEKDNKDIRTAKVVIEKDGSATAEIRSVYHGLRIEQDYLFFMINQSTEKQRKWITNHLNLSNVELLDWTFDLENKPLPSITQHSIIRFLDFHKNDEKRLFIKPSIFSSSGDIPKKLKERNDPLLIREGFQQVDSVFFQFPAGYVMENKIETHQISTEFGEYETQIHIDQNGVNYIRRFSLKEGNYSKDKYQDFRTFCSQVARFDRQIFVLVNET